jgi:hypothetical protein
MDLHESDVTDPESQHVDDAQASRKRSTRGGICDSFQSKILNQHLKPAISAARPRVNARGKETMENARAAYCQGQVGLVILLSAVLSDHGSSVHLSWFVVIVEYL